jgi:hypothetical protein
MSTILIDLLQKYWPKIAAVIAILALGVFACVQHVELDSDATKLVTASALHQEDTQRSAVLGKDITAQNDAVTALQASQTTKEQAVEKALVVAKVQEQKVAVLLAPTENKKPVSCEAAMPDVRAILKGLTQ